LKPFSLVVHQLASDELPTAVDIRH